MNPVVLAITAWLSAPYAFGAVLAFMYLRGALPLRLIGAALWLPLLLVLTRLDARVPDVSQDGSTRHRKGSV